MAYQLPTDVDNKKFFGKKTADGNNAFLPAVFYASDGVTPLLVVNGKLQVDAQLTGSNI